MKLIIAPRTHREISADPIRLKPPPNKKPFENQSLLLTLLPSVSMSLPMILGFYLMSRGMKRTSSGTVYMTMGLTTAIGSAITGAILAALNLHKRNEKARYDERLRKRSYREYLKYLQNTLKEHINYAENILRNDYPSFSELISIRGVDSSDSVTCLNRAVSDTEGKIILRLGIGSKTYTLPIRYDNDFPLIADTLQNEMADIISKNGFLERVPICVCLDEGKSLSVIADKVSDCYCALMMLAAGVCLSYSPNTVKVGFSLTDPLYNKARDSLKFMPHLIDLSEDGGGAADDEYVLIIFTDSRPDNPNKNKGRIIWILLGVDGGDILLHVTDGTAFMVEDGERSKISLDLISQSDFEAVMRTCCRLRDFKPDASDSGIPLKVPILEMLQDIYRNKMPKPPDDCGFGYSESDIIDNWQSDRAIYDLTIPLGVGISHEPVFLNLHERGDGPHGLIAGMTGSGKSELLISMILTIAVKYPPWYAAFFLIDYKGGGMAGTMEKLPHVIGSISNLSGSDIGRAFLSIRSENERRERLFCESGVNNIQRYQEKYRDGIVKEPLPHIFIIIDEFAQLKLEEPDYMQDMIAMSRVGRSLGIHLILCTQKPSGSVDGQIISNVGFQIALKLQDPMDSKEIIRRPDAAYLSNPGRAILRCGNDERVVTFQAAYSLSPHIPPTKKKVIEADYYGRPIEEMYGETRNKDDKGEMSLDYLLKMILLAWKKKAIELRPMWLPKLPELLPIEKVYEIISFDEGEGIPIGLWDDPVSVGQGVLRLNVEEGNVLICGMPYSGKSAFLETFIRGYFGIFNEPVLNPFFIFDWGGGKLSEFETLSETCGYLSEGDEEKAQEIISTLLAPHDENGSIRKILVIDGIGNLTEQAGYAMSGLIRELLRKSNLLNIRVIVTAYGINGKEVNKSMQGYFRQFIALRQQDLYQYSEIMSEPGFKGRTDLCPGRGYAKHGGRIVEFQTGLSEWR